MDLLEEPAVTGSRLDRLLAASVTSRLHLALVLVGRVKAPADVVLDLCWPQVDLDTNLLMAGPGVWGFGERVARLFYWHGAAQRLDALRTPRWPVTDRVFVNRYGAPINAEQADAVLAHRCRQAGLPVVPLAGLRHPSWAGS